MNALHSTTRLLGLLAASAAFASLTGCATTTGRYACGAPAGVTCMDARRVYELTETTDRIQGVRKGSERAQASERPAEYGAPRKAVPAAQGSVVIERGALTFASVQNPIAGAVLAPPVVSGPVRTPPKVMRVWINAWEDEAGDLHAASTVYTEIQPRRWSVGEPAVPAGTRLRLIEPLTSAAKPSTATSNPLLAPVSHSADTTSGG